MELWEQISRQRVQYIIDSYQLSGDVPDEFADLLEELLLGYPPPLIELAIVEQLILGWAMLPMPRGMIFLKKVRDRLAIWEEQPIIPKITPNQFQQITGLDPTPVFGAPLVIPVHP